MRKRAIVVEKAPGKLSLALDKGDMPSGCCGSLANEEAGAPSGKLTPAEPEQEFQSACAACSSTSCSHMRLFPLKDGQGDVLSVEVSDSSAWKLGQQVTLVFPLSSTLINSFLSLMLPFGLATALFFLLSSLFPSLPKGISWIIALLAFFGIAWLVTALLFPRMRGRGLRIEPAEDCPQD